MRRHWTETGAGAPLLLIHEFGGDSRSWRPQVAHFARRYRCVVHSGHLTDLEEPALFNHLVEQFHGQVEAGCWA